MFQPYLDTLNLARLRICLSRSRMSSHRLFIDTGRWRKPVSVPIDDDYFAGPCSVHLFAILILGVTDGERLKL